jgi:hypothetical protein
MLHVYSKLAKASQLLSQERIGLVLRVAHYRADEPHLSLSKDSLFTFGCIPLIVM